MGRDAAMVLYKCKGEILINRRTDRPPGVLIGTIG